MKLKHKLLTMTPALIALTFSVGSAYAQQGANAAARTPAQAGSASATYTDGQILQIVRSLNDAEIKQAKEALGESKNADVTSVAEMIVTDHENANEQVDDLLKGDTSLDDSDFNDSLNAKLEKNHESLQDLAGAAYDCSYLQKQITQHQEAISLAKTQLAPNAKSAGLKQFLTGMEPKLQHHLQMAQQSSTKLSCK